MRLTPVLALLTLVFVHAPDARAELPAEGCALPNAPARVAGGEAEALIAVAGSCYFPGLGHCLVGRFDRAAFFAGAYVVLGLLFAAALVPTGTLVPLGVVSFVRLLLPALGIVGLYGWSALDACRTGLESDALTGRDCGSARCGSSA